MNVDYEHYELYELHPGSMNVLWVVLIPFSLKLFNKGVRKFDFCPLPQNKFIKFIKFILKYEHGVKAFSCGS